MVKNSCTPSATFGWMIMNYEEPRQTKSGTSNLEQKWAKKKLPKVKS